MSEILYYVLGGVIVGYILGGFFSVKNEYQIMITKDDIKKANEAIEKEEKQEPFDYTSIVDKKENFNFYRVNMPFFVYASHPEHAYYMVRKSLKKCKGVFFKHGSIDMKNTYVEKVTEDEINKSYEEK